MNHPLADVFGDADLQGPVGSLTVETAGLIGDHRIESGKYAGAIDVALNDVAAEGAAGGGRQFEIDPGAGSERAERSAVEGLLGEVGVKVSGVRIEGGETDAGNAERVTFAQAGGDPGASTVMRRTPPRSVRLTRVPVCSMMPVNMEQF